jgi:hypothetical protein
MGAYDYMSPRLQQILPDHLAIGYVGRPLRSSPAESSGDGRSHDVEQDRILRGALYTPIHVVTPPPPKGETVHVVWEVRSQDDRTTEAIWANRDRVGSTPNIPDLARTPEVTDTGPDDPSELGVVSPSPGGRTAAARTRRASLSSTTREFQRDTRPAPGAPDAIVMSTSHTAPEPQRDNAPPPGALDETEMSTAGIDDLDEGLRRRLAELRAQHRPRR